MGDVHPLVLTGGYAVKVHGLVNRLSKDLYVAAEDPEPMEKMAATLRAGPGQRCWQVEQLETGPLSARLIATGEEREVDVLKEALGHAPHLREVGRAPSSPEQPDWRSLRAPLAPHGRESGFSTEPWRRGCPSRR
nr:hypothetical protein [Streptomyces pratensis]